MSLTYSLNATAYFEAVARHGSLTEAAREMEVSPSAVSQQIKVLEEQLGVALFVREGRRLAITEDGQRMFCTARTALRMLRDTQKQIRRGHEPGALTLRMPQGLAERWLTPRLGGLLVAHSDVSLRIETLRTDPVPGSPGTTVDVLFGNTAPAHMSVLKTVSDYLVPVATPDLVARQDGDMARVLSTEPIIFWSRGEVSWESWFAQSDLPHREPTIVTDCEALALDLAEAGAGVAMASVTLAARSMAKGRLVPVSPEGRMEPAVSSWFVDPMKSSDPLVLAVLDWIRTEIGRLEDEVSAIVVRFDLCGGDQRGAPD